MSSSTPPPSGGSPQQQGLGPQFPGQGSPLPPAPQGADFGVHPAQQPGGFAPQQAQFAPGSYQGGPGQQAPAQKPPKDFVVAWLLALFLGALGVDRFYRGFLGLGILKLVTCGGAGIWALIDVLIIIVTGGRDSTGQQLAGYDRSKKIAWIVTPIVLVLGMIFSSVNAATGADDAAVPEPDEVVAAAPAEVEDEPADGAVAEPAGAEEPAAEEPAEEAPADDAPAEAPAEEPPVAAEAPTAEVPTAQQAMTAAVDQGRTDAESAETDLQRANVLNERSETLCETVPEGVVQDWIGTVETVDANGEGKAVVVVSIEDDIEIGTWNNAFSDISDNTLIEQGDPLYDAALDLAPGDTVQFSGTLKTGSESNDACYYTSNLTEVMSIESPDYIISFSDLRTVQ